MTTPAPSNAVELEELLLDQGKLDKYFVDGQATDEFKELVRGYVKNVKRDDPGLTKELIDQLEKGQQKFLEEQKERDGAEPTGHNGRLRVGGKDGGGRDDIYEALELDRKTKMQIAATGRGPGVSLSGEWASFGEMLAAVDHNAIERNGIPAVYKDMTEGQGGDGGFLVPEEYRADLLRLSLERSVVRPRARVIPMATPTMRIPSIKDTSHASTVFGGVSASWVGEAGDVSTVTQPTFSQVKLEARKLTGFTEASNELLADSAIGLEALINSLFSDAIAYFEDDAFINGTGAGQPLGILNADALVTVAAETGQGAATILYENIVNMYSRMLPQSLGMAFWFGHPDIFPQLAQMALNVGTGGSAVWISNAQSGPPATIFGRPLILTEKAQTLGTAGDLYFVDLSFYLIGDRQALSVASSPHVRFTTDETVWRFIQRVDGRPWIQSALTPRNGSTTLSPFVNLATRS